MITYEDWRNNPSDRQIDPLQEIVERHQHPQYPRKFREILICGHELIFSELWERPANRRRCSQCGNNFREQLESENEQ